MKSTTIASVFVRNMLVGAERAGHDVDQILRNCGISPNGLKHPGFRVSFTQMARLSPELALVLQDECYGLLSQPQRPGTFRMLCNTIVNGETIGESLDLYVDFLNVIGSPLRPQITKSELEWTVTLDPDAELKSVYAIEHFSLVLHRTLCWLAIARIPLARVALNYPKPGHHGEYRYVFFDSQVDYDQPSCGFSFASSYLEQPNLRTKDDLEPFLNQTSATLLSQARMDENFSMRVRHWIEKRLRYHRQAPTIEQTAQHLGMHPQALRRLLSKEGCSYQDLKMETRRDLAINLLTHKRHSVEEISELLDFSESRAFIRAFKKWTGLTPLAYKKLTQDPQRDIIGP